MAEGSDVVVIGGGINGVSIAFHLAKHSMKVTLLEKDFIASGPTGWSSAIIRQHYSNPVTARMAMKSAQVWQHFDDIVGGDAGYTQTGFLIGVTPQDVDGLKANIEFQKSLGINTQFVSLDEIHEIEPHLDPTGLEGFAFEPEGGYCDPSTAANNFAAAAQRLGAKVHTNVTATNIQIEAGVVSAVETNQGTFPTDRVVVAAGPWSIGLLQKLGVEVPMVTARIKIGLYRRPEALDRHRIFGDFINQVYIRPETGHQMMVGSISPEEAEDQVPNPDHFKEKVEMEVLADFAERAANRYPKMRAGHLASHFASLYDITPDWHPILDQVPGVEGVYLCAGSSGHGFKLSPAVGEMMSKLILFGKQPGDDIHLFAFDRFVTGKPVRGRYEYSILG